MPPRWPSWRECDSPSCSWPHRRMRSAWRRYPASPCQETQPLGVRSPHGVVLCGVPKPEMRTGVTVRFFERLIGELERRYRYVILDVGADLLGAEAAVHRCALGRARLTMLVAAADLVG